MKIIKLAEPYKDQITCQDCGAILEFVQGDNELGYNENGILRSDVEKKPYPRITCANCGYKQIVYVPSHVERIAAKRALENG